MARVSRRPVDPLLSIALFLATLASGAVADTLYWWKTADGGVEVGPTPPPGAQAVPWDPEAPPAASGPAASEPAAPRRSPKPSAARRPATPASASAAADDCFRHQDRATAVREANRRVSNLESKIERLENTDVSHSFTRCREDRYNPGCDRGAFDRDAELERAREELVQAEEALSDVEARARDAGVPRECLD